MRLIVGLGNPGNEYATTRHNVGFLVVEEFGKQHRAGWSSDPLLNARLCSLEGGALRLLEPQTMMNNSGGAVAASQQRWGVSPQDMLIVCDDVNLPLGSLRLRPSGGAGGHHGLASCLERLGTEDVPRLRIGVGTEPLPKDLTEFVLSPFLGEERPIIHEAIAGAVSACELWATEGIQAAMNQVNPRTRT